MTTSLLTDERIVVLPLPPAPPDARFGPPEHDCAIFCCDQATYLPPAWGGHGCGVYPLGTEFGTGPITLARYAFGVLHEAARELGDTDLVFAMCEALRKRWA